MLPIRNILIPTDFSGASGLALGYGLALALKLQARLILAHIVATPAGFHYAFPVEDYELERRAFAAANSRMPTLIPAELRDKVHVQSIIRAGDIRSELLRIVNEEKADIVVMGTHGHRSVERFLLGSTAESMLRKSPIPILTVPSPASGREMNHAETAGIRSMLYATDLSSSMESGLRYTAELARIFQAEVTVLHVLPLKDIDYWSVDLAGTPSDDEGLMAAARQRLESEVHRIVPGMRVSMAVVKGIPYRAITEFAAEKNADILLLHLQNKSFLERTLLGSTAERVVRTSPVPVLAIPGNH